VNEPYLACSFYLAKCIFAKRSQGVTHVTLVQICNLEPAPDTLLFCTKAANSAYVLTGNARLLPCGRT